MPILLLIIAALMIAAGINNRQDELKELVKQDFAPTDGTASFFIWIVVLFLIGSIGYVKAFKPFSNVLLLLVFLVLFLSNANPGKSAGGGFFVQFKQALDGLSTNGTGVK